jgi:hypothetical protein
MPKKIHFKTPQLTIYDSGTGYKGKTWLVLVLITENKIDDKLNFNISHTEPTYQLETRS